MTIPTAASPSRRFDLSRAAPALITGAVASIMIVIESVSYGVLIFSGDRLAAFVSAGIAAALAATVVSGLIMSLFSSYHGNVSGPQSKLSPILAMAAAAVAAVMPETAAPEQVFLTVMAVIVASSLVTGLFLFALGSFKLGGLIRFIPYPVIAGFLAGTGWLLLLGSMKAMTGVTVTLHSLPRFFEPGLLALWVPGLIFAVAARTLMSRTKHFLAMPGLLAAAVGLIYLAFHVGGLSIEQARDANWLLRGAGGDLFHFRTLTVAAGADWNLVMGQAGSIASLVLVATVSILLNSSALELAAECEMDLDRELKTAGVANLASGLAGGMPGFTSLSVSGLVVKMGGRSRPVGVLAALGAAAVLFFGGSLLGYVPRPVVGGLLLFLGLTFIREWVIDTRRQLPPNEYLVVLLILVVVGLFGFLQGVLLGVVAAIVLFVVKYSRVNVVKHALAGTRHLSQVDRPPACKQVLREQGEGIFILKLHGFIFFGTANGLYTRIKERTDHPDQPPLRYVALDFREVSGLDTSAVISLIKMRQLAAKTGFVILLSHLDERSRKMMEREQLIRPDDPNLLVFADLDHALEWCEDQVLLEAEIDQCAVGLTLRDHLEAIFPESFNFDNLAPYLERREVPAGQYFIEQGEPSDDMFFIESGRVAVHLKLPTGEILRLRKMGAGNVVGEMGLYLGRKRSASVITDEDAVVYRLSRESLAAMESEHPKTAAAFHKFMVRMLSQRLLDTDQTLKALLA